MERQLERMEASADRRSVAAESLNDMYTAWWGMAETFGMAPPRPSGDAAGGEENDERSGS